MSVLMVQVSRCFQAKSTPAAPSIWEYLSSYFLIWLNLGVKTGDLVETDSDARLIIWTVSETASVDTNGLVDERALVAW